MCIYSYNFKLQSPWGYSPLDASHLSGHFFHCSEQVLKSLILIPSSDSAILCFTSSTSTKHSFPFEVVLIQRNKRKFLRDENRWIGRVGHESHTVFGQQLLSTQRGVGRCAHNSPIMKCANTMNESSKKIHWNWRQPLTIMPAGTLIRMGS